MNDKQKENIIEGVRQYLSRHNISQAAFARKYDINASYLSNMINGQFTYKSSNGRTVEIPERYFTIAAQGAKLEKNSRPTRWAIVETPQFIQVISALEAAKQQALTRMIIGESGCGKTLSINQFTKANPTGTFRITVSSLHKINDIMDDLADVMGIQLSTRRASRLKELSVRIRALASDGLRPLIIIDEAENLKPGTIGLCKAVYDAVCDVCGFVLIGTDELTFKLDRLQRYNREGIVQFRRRFKAGMVKLRPIEKSSFDSFMQPVEDRELKKLLKGICSNYGELHDFLLPALTAAENDGVCLDNDYFKAMYYLN